MAVETDTERAAMLADFGVDATVGANTFTVIFENAYVEVGDIAGTYPTALALDSDVSAYSIARGTALTINSVSYKVRIPQPDGTGYTLLVLEKQ